MSEEKPFGSLPKIPRIELDPSLRLDGILRESGMSDSLRPQWQPRPLLRQMGSWALALAASIGAIGLTVDFVLVAVHADVRAAIASGMTAAALGLFVALILAPVAALVAMASRALATSRFRVARRLWTAPVVLAAALVAVAWLGPRLQREPLLALPVAAAFVVGVVVSAYVARGPRHRLFGALELAVASVALALDMVVVTPADREVHDLLAILTVCGTLAVLAPFRRRLVRARPRRLLLLFGVVSALALVHLVAVDRLAPGWRLRAWQYGRYEWRMARALQAAIDFDMDGTSPAAWGGDCDDLDPRRNPRARERRDVPDTNCNGVVPPDTPSDRDRGLAPPKGDPDLPPDAIDRVILITIDCFRNEAFRPDVTPRLVAEAERGVRFTRLYSGGSQTYVSTPLMQRGRDGGRPIASTLAAAGIGSTAITGPLAGQDRQKTIVLPGFTRVDNPQGIRMRAAQISDTLLRYVREAKGTKQYFWAHYFDAHRGRVQPPEFPPTRREGEDPELSLYYDTLRYVDEHVARVVDTLAEDGLLDRSVVIISADHGEAFGDHGIYDHAVGVYESVTHVPGILIAPGLPRGSYDNLVSHRDLPATILGAFGLAAKNPDAERFGRSWLRLRDAPLSKLHEFVVTRSARASRGGDPLTPMMSIIEGRFKLARTFDDDLTEMYDLEADPEEKNDLTTIPHLVGYHVLRRDLALFRDLDGYP